VRAVQVCAALLVLAISIVQSPPASAGGDLPPVKGAAHLLMGSIVRMEVSPKSVVLLREVTYTGTGFTKAHRGDPSVCTVTVDAKTKVSIADLSKSPVRRKPIAWKDLKPGLLMFAWTRPPSAAGNRHALALDVCSLTPSNYEVYDVYAKLIGIGASTEAGRLLATQDKKALAARKMALRFVPGSPEVSPLWVIMAKAIAAGTAKDLNILLDWLGTGEHSAEPKAFGLAFAVGRNKNDAAKTLIDREASASWRDWRGRTALHWAAEAGNADGVALLLGCGADRTVTDKDGKTALDLARQAGKQNVVDLLDG